MMLGIIDVISILQLSIQLHIRRVMTQSSSASARVVCNLTEHWQLSSKVMHKCMSARILSAIKVTRRLDEHQLSHAKPSHPPQTSETNHLNKPSSTSLSNEPSATLSTDMTAPNSGTELLLEPENVSQQRDPNQKHEESSRAQIQDQELNRSKSKSQLSLQLHVNQALGSTRRKIRKRGQSRKMHALRVFIHAVHGQLAIPPSTQARLQAPQHLRL